MEPPGDTETLVAVEHRLADLNAAGEGFDALDLRLNAGVAPGWEAALSVRLGQRGPEPLRMQTVGMVVRGRLLGEPADPEALTVYGGYANDTSEERDHLLHVGSTGRYRWRDVFVGVDARLSNASGGALDTSWEVWLGANASYVLVQPFDLVVGLETFTVAPLAGDRLFDLTYGLSAGSRTWYYGPSVSGRVGPLWTGLSAVTGTFVSDPASFLMVRFWVGVAH